MNENVLRAIEKAGGFKALFKILLAHSRVLSKSKIPLGYENGDFVSDAITRALEGSWEEGKDGDIINFLKKEVKNAYRRPIRRAEHTKRVSPSQGTDPLANAVDLEHPVDKILEAEEEREKIYSEIRQCKKNEADKIVDVLEAVDAGYQNLEIAELCEIEVSEVENYKKRIKYRLKSYYQKTN